MGNSSGRMNNLIKNLNRSKLEAYDEVIQDQTAESIVGRK